MIENNEESKRPVFLTILCVLTFISSFVGALSALFTPLFSDIFVTVVSESPFVEESLRPALIGLINAGWRFHFWMLLFHIGSFIGAVYMWQLKKIGFHFYAISNLAILFIPTVVLNMLVGIENVLSTIIFIGFYAVFLKLMK